MSIWEAVYPHYPVLYAKNERAGKIMGYRPTNVVPFDEPAGCNAADEPGYHCPVCIYDQIRDGEYDERLTWSEYEGFIWCAVCNKDYPSCLCRPDSVDAAIDVFLRQVASAIARAPEGNTR